MALYIGNDTSRRLTHPTQLLDALPPMRRHQFKEGRSMAEAAKAWVAAGGRLPHSIAKVTGSDELLRAHFEYGTRVWGGGTGQTDVMAFVPDAVIAVEAKVDESFDQIVLDWICAEHRENPRSPPHRLGVIQRYADAFAVSLRQLMELRYQLLQRTLCAALTAQEHGLQKAWMIVQSFCPPGLANSNRPDFERFASVVGSAPRLNGIPVRLAWAQHQVSRCPP
jgi:hypothetical protein